MTDGRTREKLNFGGYSGYYQYMSYYQGYGGFDWFADVLYMNESTWTSPNGVGYQYGWCDTGYQNEAAMSSATSLGFIYQYGIMESAGKHSFTLDSMNAAASFSKNAVWDLISYTENNGSLYQKAADKLKVSFTGEHVNLAALGNPDDFKNIAAVAFQLVNYGHAGNKCTYGYPVVGAQLVIGDVKVTFSKKADLPDNNGRLLPPYLQHHQLDGVPHVNAERQAPNAWHGAENSSNHHQYHQGSAGHDPGFSPQFHLPAVEHFF
jgi:hypothetical protein